VFYINDNLWRKSFPKQNYGENDIHLHIDIALQSCLHCLNMCYVKNMLAIMLYIFCMLCVFAFYIMYMCLFIL